MGSCVTAPVCVSAHRPSAAPQGPPSHLPAALVSTFLVKAASMTYWEEIVSLLSKEPVGGSEQVLCAGPVNFGEEVLEILVDVSTSAAASA